MWNFTKFKKDIPQNVWKSEPFFNIFQIIFIFIIIIHFLDRVAVREFILLPSVTGCPSVCLVWVLSHHHRHRQHHRQPLSPILQRLTKFFFLFPRQGKRQRDTQRENVIIIIIIPTSLLKLVTTSNSKNRTIS